MTFAAPFPDPIARLNHSARSLDTFSLLQTTLADPSYGPLALVSSFGAESVVLLHLVSRIDPDFPVLFIDTEMLFAQTLAYQRQLARDLGLGNIRRITPLRADLVQRDADNLLHRADPDACCTLRKVEPLARALKGFSGWVTGRKRFQNGARARMEHFELDAQHRLRINPLALWQPADIAAYMDKYNLPRHPLVQKGYPSIGCAPCTTQPATGGDARSGRWQGAAKTECGIHLTRPAQDTVIVNDDGFAPEDWSAGFHPPSALGSLTGLQQAALALDLPNDADVDGLTEWIDQIDLIRITFPGFADGRGFSLARRLRALGFQGRLRASGPLLADQYAMLRRSGFDEVQIPAAHADRQPEPQWLARSNWRAHDYQHRLRNSA